MWMYVVGGGVGVDNAGTQTVKCLGRSANEGREAAVRRCGVCSESGTGSDCTGQGRTGQKRREHSRAGV